MQVAYMNNIKHSEVLAHVKLTWKTERNL